MSGLYIPDPKNYTLATLKNAVLTLAETDPTVKKSDFKSKATLLNALISRGVSMQYFPSKSSFKEAKGAYLAARRNVGRVVSDITRVSSRIPGRLDAMQQRIDARLADRKAKLAARLEKAQIKKNQAALKKQAAAQLKADKKAAAAERKMVRQVQAQLKKDKAAAAREQRALKKANKFNIPEPSIMGANFRGPLLPTQSRRVRKARTPRAAI